MKNHLARAIALTMILPPLFMELMVGNIPGFAFFNPVLLAMLFFGYSLPVLVIREAAVRWKLNIAGLFLLGIAYGILNEGLGAKTLLINSGIPTPSFDDYGFYFGVSLPWALYITVIHAFVSVLFPILFVHYIYPEIRDKKWLGNKTVAVFSSLSLIVTGGIFLSPAAHAVSPIYLPVLLSMMVVLFLLAKFLPKSNGLKESPSGLAPLFLGMVFIAVFALGLDLLSGAKVPQAIFYLCWLGILLACGLLLRSKSWLSLPALVLFGIGLMMVLAVTGTVNTVAMKGHAEGILIGLCFEIAFIWSVAGIRRRMKRAQPA